MAIYTWNSPSNGYSFRLTLNENVGTPAQNYSTISWTLEHYQGNISYNGLMTRQVIINGVYVYGQYTDAYNAMVHSYNTWWTVASGTTGVIPHADNGTGSFTFSFYWAGTSGGYGPGTVSQSGTQTLTTIPRYAAYLSGTPYAQSITGVQFDVAVLPDVTCDYLTVSLDGAAATNFSGDFSGWKVVTMGGTLTAGANHTYQTNIRRKDSQLWTASATKNVTTLAPAAITGNSQNFNDEANPYITFTNPTGSTMDVWLEVNPSGTHYAARNSITNNGTYTWSLTTGERNQLRAVIPNSNTGTIRMGLYTNLGGSHTYSSTADTTLSIVNANPTFADFTYSDTNTTTPVAGGTVGITGNNQYIIQGYSTLRATISSANKAVALKSATMNKYTFSIDGTNVEQAYSASDINKDIGVLAAATSNKSLTITAVDSRTNQTAVVKTVNILPYSAPVIVATGVRDNNFEAATTLTVSGTFSRLTVGTDKNTIAADAVKYRYKQDGGAFGDWVTMTRTLGTGTFATTTEYLTLDNASTFTFEVSVTDKLATTVNTFIVDRGAPIMMISDNLNSIGIGKMPTTADMVEVADGITIDATVVAKDHGTATTAQVVNFCYGTSDTPPTASTTPIGAIYVQYIS